jgi:hypothetical protein
VNLFNYSHVHGDNAPSAQETTRLSKLVFDCEPILKEPYGQMRGDEAHEQRDVHD